MAHANVGQIKIFLCMTGHITIPLFLSLSISLFYSSHPSVEEKDGSFPSSGPWRAEHVYLSNDPPPPPPSPTPLLSQPFCLVCIFVACLCEPLAAKKASKSVGVSGARPWRITNVWNPIQRLNSGGPEPAGGSWGSFTLVKDSNSLRLLGSTNNLTEAKDPCVFQREL